ncbi:TRAP transporter large permease [Vibrio penaeicida]|uniref:TRAP transporter large permease protein n=1 Tax=Vibrio penaeicida TaxID=104609 RepID=A0AAV5NPF3_9VIBR|nr:TRAP transporter large permease subunit [Vibrio penaeicida]RTZ22986.1 TRAP transporter large permease subunit [Vibrio penaeicida]GLQ72525.1 C4-dicarboxylate ABC transporter [Vibrio penaeicida]
MEINEILAIGMFATFILLLFTGFPVAWILGGVSILFSAIALGLDTWADTWIGIDWQYVSIVIPRIWDTMNNWVLVALPMFIYMGLMLDRSGVAQDLMTNLVRLFGRVRGGLAITVTIVGLLLAASTGIIGAAVVLLSVLGIPLMLKQGYSKSLACGTVCATGTLGILIPPSIMLVMMGDRIGLSVGDLFLGALFPGLLLAALYVGYIVFTGLISPSKAPLSESAEPVSILVILQVFRAVLAPAGLIVAVLGSIFFGIATPTEASGVGAAGATLLAWSKGALNKTVLKEVGEETTKTTAFIFALFVGATAFSLVLRGLGGDELIEGALTNLDLAPSGIIIAILIAVFLLGFFLDWIEITLIVLPLVAPVVLSLGFDLIWFTVLFAVCLQTSFLTPPVGFALFYMKGVAPDGVTIGDIYKGVIPFILLQVIALAIVFNFQQIVTWLPGVAYGY